jgi:predicted CXXCH cytochrome family protein
MRALFDSLRAGIIAVVAFLSACSRQDSSLRTPQAPAQIEDSVPIPEFAASLPQVGDVEGYTGSKACQDCHRDQFSTWHRTYHRTMTQIASKSSVQASFNQVVLTNDGTRFTLSQKGDEFWARMEKIAPPDAGPAPESVDVRLSMITGSHHMQVFWVAEGHGNMQIGFPFTWLIPEKRWVPRHSTFVRPPDTEHRPEPWNIVCSRCHTTGVEPHFYASERVVETHVGELGISCEACHGPGKRHVELRTAAAAAGATHTLEPKEIIHPEELSPQRAGQICGFCHSMKWIDKTENWRQAGFQYRPGDDLEESTPIIRASRVQSIAGLAEYLERNPSILADFFWNDGMIRVSGREYNGLLDSPCVKGQKFSCISCHSGHKSEPDDMLSASMRGNEACLQCHEKFRQTEQLAAHTRHTAASSGSECYNCHMPHTTYGVLKAIRSHQVSSPRVADDISSGRPNACNLCHLDKTLAWTQDYLHRWHGQDETPLTETATNLSHAVRLSVAGDAGQRVLLAWHLGWEPALKISGTNWIAPVLGQLFDDPYAAVRLVAERSAKTIGQLPPAGYDFTIPPDSRPAVRDQVWQKWLASRGPPDPNAKLLLADAPSLAEQRALYGALLAWRDHRRIRLRE